MKSKVPPRRRLSARRQRHHRRFRPPRLMPRPRPPPPPRAPAPPPQLRPAGVDAAPAPAAPAKKRLGRIRHSEITIFYRQLASLIKAGGPILQALWVISEQTSNGSLVRILTGAQEEIRNGQPFSAVFARHPRLFPSLDLALIRAGEDSGNLHETLLRVATYRQKQEEIVSRIRTALAYPCLMGLTGIGTVAYMLT